MQGGRSSPGPWNSTSEVFRSISGALSTPPTPPHGEHVNLSTWVALSRVFLPSPVTTLQGGAS